MATNDTTAINPSHQGHLFIQAGAFKTLENATKLKDKLISELRTLVTIKANAESNEPLYKVHIGPYIDMSRADLTRLRLQ